MRRTQQSIQNVGEGLFVVVGLGVLEGPSVRVAVGILVRVRVGEGPQVGVRVGVLLGISVLVAVRVGDGPQVGVRVGVRVGSAVAEILQETGHWLGQSWNLKIKSPL